ncbi:MAG TPA: META domain-containing protein [Candidatus Limnocylindria bacterium]
MNHLRFVLIAMVLAACSMGNAAPTLDGRTFLSTRVTENGAERPLVDGTQIRLAFSDGNLSASAGCNTIGGTFSIDGDTLVFVGGGMTEMGCDADRHAQDDWLSEFLGSEPDVTLDGDELTLSSGGVTITLLDREVADPDLPLVGTTWTVTSIISGDAVSTVPDGAVATFTFADDGTVEVNTGCNTGGGSYELSGSTIRFSGVAITDMACEGAGGALEASVVPILAADAIEVTIEAGSLTLDAGDVGLGLTGG